MKKPLLHILATLVVLLTATLPAFAVRTTLTPVTPVDENGTVSANAADYTYTAADAVNFNRFVFTGREIILVQNTDGSAHTVTITSAADDLGRTKDISGYSLGANEFAVFGPFQLKGWLQSDGYFYLQADSNLIKFCILRLPPIQ